MVSALVAVKGALEGERGAYLDRNVRGAAEQEVDGGGGLFGGLEDFDWDGGPDFAEEALERERDVVGEVGDAEVNGCARFGRREAPVCECGATSYQAAWGKYSEALTIQHRRSNGS